MSLSVLVLNNQDASPKKVEMTLSTSAVPAVLAWYGAYYSGDRYTARLDGKKLKLDLNGEMVT